MKNSKLNKMRAEAKIAIPIPAMAPPDMGPRVVYCESAELELELDETLPAVIVVVANSIPAAMLDPIVLAAVESEAKVEVELDEGPCESKSAFTIASTRNRDLNVPPATTRTATNQAPNSTLNYLD